MRKAYIFDMDDTLICSDSHIYVYDQNHDFVEKINSQQYVHKRDDIKRYHQNGYLIKTCEFGGDGSCDHADHLSYQHLMRGETLEAQISILRSCANNADLYLVTGRGNKRETLRNVIKERFDIDIPVDHIYPVSNCAYMEEVRNRLSEEELERLGQITNFKTNSLYDILRKGYDYVEFYDDDPRNIETFHRLMEHFPQKIEYKTFLIGK